VCLIAVAICASTVLASAQVTSSVTESNSSQTNTSPAAYVYVSSSVGAGQNHILGYSAAANGSLTAIPGSPFPWSVSYLAVNGAWLFGVYQSIDANGGNLVDSFSIGSKGALSKADEVGLNDFGGGAISIYLDHTGSSLYADYYTTNNDYLTYSINQSTGALSYVSTLMGGPANNSPLSFIGNNQYGYSSSCYHFSPSIYGVQRASNGSLTSLNINTPYPAEKSGGFYCPWLAAADPTNHLAIALSPLTQDWTSDGPTQLASYTVDSSGNLTTTSTYSNMPNVQVGGVIDYWMSPSGKYLAVGGTNGLQVFHFNGANPITRFTGLLTKNEIDQLFWDNSNHLYAISRKAGKLYVYTVTSTGAAQAPGSPHNITSPANLIVLPK
jgi:hypothetical protein